MTASARSRLFEVRRSLRITSACAQQIPILRKQGRCGRRAEHLPQSLVLRVGLGGACVDGVQFLAGLEADRFAGRDADLGSCAGIAADSGFAGADAEDAKPAQFDALTGCQSLLEALEDRIHCGFGLGARQTRALDDVMDDVLLNQWGNLACATGIDFTTSSGGDARDFGANSGGVDCRAVDFFVKNGSLRWFEAAVEGVSGGFSNCQCSDSLRKMGFRF